MQNVRDNQNKDVFCTSKPVPKGEMILGEGLYYSMDCYKTKLNNNVLIVGNSGSGKTRSFVTPNLLQATGSYIISDPKGDLYNKYAGYLKSKGYIIQKLDLKDLSKSCHYNFFEYIHNTQDVLKVAHMLTYELEDKEGKKTDPFWDEACSLLLQAIIAYLKFYRPKEEQTMDSVFKLLCACEINEDNSEIKNPLDRIFDELQKRDPQGFALRQYKKFRVAAGKTLKSILISVFAKLATFDIPELREVMQDNELDIPMIGLQKTAFFVCVSDTDRSLDILANIFFTQAMNVLCEFADQKCIDNKLPVSVQFILDDFATNCRIGEFPRMIASIRSRGISTMLIIQSEAQLEKYYGVDAKTIIGNCDSYVYLGSTDIDTAESIARRVDVPLKKVLYMPIGSNWIFRRGSTPINGTNFDLEMHFGKIKPKISGLYFKEYKEKI